MGPSTLKQLFKTEVILHFENIQHKIPFAINCLLEKIETNKQFGLLKCIYTLCPLIAVLTEGGWLLCLLEIWEVKSQQLTTYSM